MIIESIKNGPLIWSTIKKNAVTRPKKYSELSAREEIQADCDVKAKNIILQGLPPEVYALVSNHKVTKELWERIQLLMQGTLLRKQEREASGSNSGNNRTVYLLHWQGGRIHVPKKCTYTEKEMDVLGFKDKVMSSFEQSNVVNHLETEITSDSNIIPYSQYVIESQQATVWNSNSLHKMNFGLLQFSFDCTMKTQVVNYTKINLDNKSVNDTLTVELEIYKEDVKVLKDEQNVDLKSNDNVFDSSAQSVEIDHLKQTLSEHLKEKESLMQTVTLLKMILRRRIYEQLIERML
ncbi:hypothetical protein Tco_0053942 [Tanacetum coccineum]